MGFRMRGSSSLDALTIYTDKKNKFISDISCLQTYYTRRICMYLEEQKLLLCGIDRGFSTMKTAHFVFENGVKELGGEASLLTNTMFLNKRYFKIGEGGLPLKDTKVEDGDYFLLTLVAIAREMDYYGLNDTKVCIAAGLPFTRFGQEKTEFKDYLHPGNREFQYNGKEYYIKCSDVFLYPQCYAAVADRLGKLPAELLIVDIGSKTVDIIHTRKHIPVESDCITIPSALIQCMANINNVVYRKTNRTLTEEQIQQVMMYGNAPYSDKMVQIVREELAVFAKGIEAALKEHGFDLEMTPVVYVGGGAGVMKRFGSVTGRHIMHIEDVKANALGYEYLAYQQLKRKWL